MLPNQTVGQNGTGMRILGLIPLLIVAAVCANGTVDDNDAAAEALIRHEVSSNVLDAQWKLCISVEGKDLSQKAVDRLQDTGLRIYSSTDAACVNSMPIAAPKELADGTFEVPYGYYLHCIGPGCAVQGSMMFAFMQHDKQGWRVLRVQRGMSF
jgi:hypothetical protein